jgi:hypothetical protein
MLGAGRIRYLTSAEEERSSDASTRRCRPLCCAIWLGAVFGRIRDQRGTFVRSVSQIGMSMLDRCGSPLTTMFIVGRPLSHEEPYDDLVGVASGATGNPAILVYSARMALTERPDTLRNDLSSMTILKVIVADSGTACRYRRELKRPRAL